ncbi:hypothetical protein [Rhizobium leguminosarum]|uniref:hypothetical protein n=1 Tax=Rhizobium leguminosarum TaxID=384 RepID=UPI0012DB4B9B|nr:hypothetical protein [Rhizobium leguminosarum]
MKYDASVCRGLRIRLFNGNCDFYLLPFYYAFMFEGAGLPTSTGKTSDKLPLMIAPTGNIRRRTKTRIALGEFCLPCGSRIAKVASDALRTPSPRRASGMRDLVRQFGYDPDQDARMTVPSETILRLGAVRSFLDRGELLKPMARLVPALFAARDRARFVLSDHPVVMSNAYLYGDAALQSHGVIVFLPLAPGIAVALICPTIIARYEAIERAELPAERRSRMEPDGAISQRLPRWSTDNNRRCRAGQLEPSPGRL